MTALRDLSGQRFAMWAVLSRGTNNKAGRARWSCRCDCGVERLVDGVNLTQGLSRGCGCAARAATAIRVGERSRKHGHSSRESLSPTYISWTAMLARCKYDHPNTRYWHGMGVVVCERWHDFENFLADMGERPPEHSIDRFPDPAGNYEPGNCRWATRIQQARNRRKPDGGPTPHHKEPGRQDRRDQSTTLEFGDVANEMADG